MPASLHVARYSAQDAVRMVKRMRRLKESLGRSPGLEAGHMFATVRFTPSIGGIPTLRRWALFCAFKDDGALTAFENSPFVATFDDRAKERWRVSLHPAKAVNGTWRGWSPADEEIRPLSANEPAAVLTYGIVRPRYVAWFLRNNRRIIAHSARQDGLIARFGLADTALTASTFSIWRSRHDLSRFAYGVDTVHRPIIRPSLDIPIARHYFFCRFGLRDSEGTLDGRDPVADARVAATANRHG
jgi:hypothetical protein